MFESTIPLPRIELTIPLYMQVLRAGLVLHLSEHEVSHSGQDMPA